MADQLPPADELYAVRTGIKELTERERVLRTLMLTDPSARTGNHYLAEVREVTTTRTDLAEMKKCHPDLVAEFTFQLKQERVELAALTEDGEIVSARRMRSATKSGDTPQ
jgi:hypothetical protein